MEYNYNGKKIFIENELEKGEIEQDLIYNELNENTQELPRIIDEEVKEEENE